MKENLQAIGIKLLKNIDRVGVIVFAVLLVASGLLLYREASFNAPEPPSPPPQPFNVRIPSEEFDTVQRYLVSPQTDILQDEDRQLRRLVAVNIFDPRSVRSDAELNQEIDRDLTEATRLFNQGDLDGAQRIVDSILRRNEAHRRTLELRDRIEAARNPAVPDEPEAVPEETGT